MRAYPTCRPWTMPADYAGPVYPYTHTSGFGRSRDSDTVEESNFRVACAELLPLGNETDGEVEIVREHHWAVGWVEWIAINNDNAKAIALATELCGARELYPILSDDDHSALQMERAEETWRECYDARERLDYIRGHRGDFGFGSIGDILACVRGKYFAGDAFDIVGA